MNHLENNKLIAEFMAVEEAYNPNGNDWVLKTTTPDAYGDTDILESCKDNELQYHTDWNWLMPVVEEIHTHGCEVVISSNGVTTIYAPSGEVLAEESSEEENHMHDATYKAIVNYICTNN